MRLLRLAALLSLPTTARSVPSDSSTYAIIPRPVVLTPKRGAFTLTAAATKRARHTWRGMAGGIAGAKANHDVVMAPGSHTYFDHYQSRDEPKESLAIGGFTPIDGVYAFEPVPPQLSANEAKHLLGAQAQLWAEYMPNAKHAEYTAYPRMDARSKVLWSAKARRDFADIIGRLPTYLTRFDALDVNNRTITAK